MIFKNLFGIACIKKYTLASFKYSSDLFMNDKFLFFIYNCFIFSFFHLKKILSVGPNWMVIKIYNTCIMYSIRMVVKGWLLMNVLYVSWEAKASCAILFDEAETFQSAIKLILTFFWLILKLFFYRQGFLRKKL